MCPAVDAGSFSLPGMSLFQKVFKRCTLEKFLLMNIKSLGHIKIKREAEILSILHVLSSLFFFKKRNSVVVAFRYYPKLPSHKTCNVSCIIGLCANNMTTYLSSGIRNMDTTTPFIYFRLNYTKPEFVKVPLFSDLL